MRFKLWDVCYGFLSPPPLWIQNSGIQLELINYRYWYKVRKVITWSNACFRDYMDRFLDENESAASSRASSPHNFTSRVRPGNGMIPITTAIQSQSQPIAIQPMYTVAAPTTAQSTVVTINVSNSNPVSVSLMKRDLHDSIPNRQLQQQSCVPTSVIVSGPESGEPPTKKLKILPSGRPKLINSMLSKPPPLKPIASTGSSAFHSSSLGNVSLPPSSVSSYNATNPQERSYLSVHNTPVTDSVLFTHQK